MAPLSANRVNISVRDRLKVGNSSSYYRGFRMRALRTFVVVIGFVTLGATPARTEDMPKEYRKAINNGLKYLAVAQQTDGHWEGYAGRYPTSITALAGLALLMEGSTLGGGRYQPHLNRAVNWFAQRQNPDGSLGDR